MQRKGRRRRLNGANGRGTLAKEKPPIFGIIQRGGEVVIWMLENVQQTTIEPLIRGAVVPGTRFFTDECLTVYLSFFQFVHNARVRGKGLLSSLLAPLLR